MHCKHRNAAGKRGESWKRSQLSDRRGLRPRGLPMADPAKNPVTKTSARTTPESRSMLGPVARQV